MTDKITQLRQAMYEAEEAHSLAQYNAKQAHEAAKVTRAAFNVAFNAYTAAVVEQGADWLAKEIARDL